MPDYNSLDDYELREISKDEWNLYWQEVYGANLLQSWEYGNAKHIAQGWRIARFLIKGEDGVPIALAQVLIRRWPLIGSVVRLNRGPLIIGKVESKDRAVELTLLSLSILFSRRFQRRWWVVQVAPEIEDTKSSRLAMQALGFKRLRHAAWGSGKLLLDADQRTLLMGFNQRWRRNLKKAEKLGVSVSRHTLTSLSMDLLLNSYADLQREKGFEGLSEKLISALALQEGPLWQFNFFLAQATGNDHQAEPLGVLLSIRTGDTSTYVIGATSKLGREMQANSSLLWQAILEAKNRDCKWFDIGGLNESTTKGIAEFKRGLRAAPYKLVGEWRLGFAKKWLSFTFAEGKPLNQRRDTPPSPVRRGGGAALPTSNDQALRALRIALS